MTRATLTRIIFEYTDENARTFGLKHGFSEKHTRNLMDGRPSGSVLAAHIDGHVRRHAMALYIWLETAADHQPNRYKLLRIILAWKGSTLHRMSQELGLSYSTLRREVVEARTSRRVRAIVNELFATAVPELRKDLAETITIGVAA